MYGSQYWYFCQELVVRRTEPYSTINISALALRIILQFLKLRRSMMHIITEPRVCLCKILFLNDSDYFSFCVNYGQLFILWSRFEERISQGSSALSAQLAPRKCHLCSGFVGWGNRLQLIFYLEILPENQPKTIHSYNKTYNIIVLKIWIIIKKYISYSILIKRTVGSYKE